MRNFMFEEPAGAAGAVFVRFRVALERLQQQKTWMLRVLRIPGPNQRKPLSKLVRERAPKSMVDAVMACCARCPNGSTDVCWRFSLQPNART